MVPPINYSWLSTTPPVLYTYGWDPQPDALPAELRDLPVLHIAQTDAVRTREDARAFRAQLLAALPGWSHVIGVPRRLAQRPDPHLVWFSTQLFNQDKFWTVEDSPLHYNAVMACPPSPRWRHGLARNVTRLLLLHDQAPDEAFVNDLKVFAPKIMIADQVDQAVIRWYRLQSRAALILIEWTYLSTSVAVAQLCGRPLITTTPLDGRCDLIEPAFVRIAAPNPDSVAGVVANTATEQFDYVEIRESFLSARTACREQLAERLCCPLQWGRGLPRSCPTKLKLP